MEKSALDASAQKLFADLKAQFEKTLDQALAASASKADFTFFTAKALAVQHEVQRLRQFAEKEFDAGQTNLADKTATTVRLSLWLSIGSIVLGTAVAFLMARTITRRITRIRITSTATS